MVVFNILSALKKIVPFSAFLFVTLMIKQPLTPSSYVAGPHRRKEQR
jgi:hypothetical protein